MKITYLVFQIENFAINLIFRVRFIVALIIIFLIAPQTPKENFLLNEFHESGFFSNYGESKTFLNWLTWFTIFLFIFIHLIN